ncbi:hypothetical protein LshimejAT787_0506320 [Lyophyllum shimeji]|uniref:Uncharacterized protein n=1 Tax=Lyophyllum shimeji TaxID=47721 RepID=A0A9P3PLY3_LYOSH|nr:hypothetical protein LshimejAT787_0506320 [Lyophyllum shimeji]
MNQQNESQAIRPYQTPAPHLRAGDSLHGESKRMAFLEDAVVHRRCYPDGTTAWILIPIERIWEVATSNRLIVEEFPTTRGSNLCKVKFFTWRGRSRPVTSLSTVTLSLKNFYYGSSGTIPSAWILAVYIQSTQRTMLFTRIVGALPRIQPHGWMATHSRGWSNAFARHSSSLPASAFKYPRRPPARVRTLRRDQLQSEDFVDVSDSKTRTILLGPEKLAAKIGYEPDQTHKRGVGRRLSFPPDARGFLYYHCDPSFPPTAGEIRFRLTPDDNPATFEHGTDLIDRDGLPWSIPLWKIANTASLKEQVIRDELVQPELMRAVEKVMSEYNSELVQGGTTSKIFTLRQIVPITCYEVFTDSRSKVCPVPKSPYSGRILVRFEHSTLPQHVATRSLVLRVLKILQPIKVRIPGYDGHVPMPREGALLQSHTRVWSTNLDNPKSAYKDLNIFTNQ